MDASFYHQRPPVGHNAYYPNPERSKYSNGDVYDSQSEGRYFNGTNDEDPMDYKYAPHPPTFKKMGMADNEQYFHAEGSWNNDGLSDLYGGSQEEMRPWESYRHNFATKSSLKHDQPGPLKKSNVYVSAQHGSPVYVYAPRKVVNNTLIPESSYPAVKEHRPYSETDGRQDVQTSFEASPYPTLKEYFDSNSTQDPPYEYYASPRGAGRKNVTFDLTSEGRRVPHNQTVDYNVLGAQTYPPAQASTTYRSSFDHEFRNAEVCLNEKHWWRESLILYHDLHFLDKQSGHWLTQSLLCL